MAKIKEIGHAVLYVSDVERASAWYRDVLGMEFVVSSERFAGRFLSFGRRDHDLALLQKEGAGAHGRGEYNHLAFELEGSLDDLKAFHRRLLDKGVTVTGTVDHGISYGIYFLDPDGHQLEVFLPRTAPGRDPKAAFREVGVIAAPIDLDAVEG